MNFVAGIFEFTVAGVPPGGAVMVKVLSHATADLNAYYMFGATPDLWERWYPFVSKGDTGAVFMGEAIDLHFVDGARGDGDLKADGIVTVCGAPARNEHPRPWQNPHLNVNVNDDGYVSPIDVLLLIDSLNTAGARALAVPPLPPQLPPCYFDVSGDNKISPIDVLIVIDDLNRNGARRIPRDSATGDGEGESSRIPLAQLQPLPSDARICDLWAGGAVPEHSTSRVLRSSVSGEERGWSCERSCGRCCAPVTVDRPVAPAGDAASYRLARYLSLPQEDLEDLLDDLVDDIAAQWWNKR